MTLVDFYMLVVEKLNASHEEGDKQQSYRIMNLGEVKSKLLLLSDGRESYLLRKLQELEDRMREFSAFERLSLVFRRLLEPQLLFEEFQDLHEQLLRLCTFEQERPGGALTVNIRYANKSDIARNDEREVALFEEVNDYQMTITQLKSWNEQLLGSVFTMLERRNVRVQQLERELEEQRERQEMLQAEVAKLNEKLGFSLHATVPQGLSGLPVFEKLRFRSDLASEFVVREAENTLLSQDHFE